MLSDNLKLGVTFGTLIFGIAAGWADTKNDAKQAMDSAATTSLVNQHQDMVLGQQGEALARVDERTRAIKEQLDRIERQLRSHE